jgi:hypothetical protein
MVAGYAKNVLGDATAVQQGLAEKVAELGMSSEQIYQTYLGLALQGGAFEENISEAGNDLTIQTEGVGAAFGVNAASSKALENRRSGRVAKFGGGGGAMVTQQGTGLGVAK